MRMLQSKPPAYSHLPAPPSFRARSNSLLTKRYFRLLVSVLFSTTAFYFFLHTSLPPLPALDVAIDIDSHVAQDLVLLPPPYPSPPTPEQQQGLPPLFEAWKDYERNLPQHTQDDGTTKFIYFKNHAWGSGWGNVLQEMLLNSHLAYLSGRSFVFYNYTWDRSPSEYSSFNGNKKIPSRVPVSAMLAGPMIGGSFDPAYLHDPLFDVQTLAHPRSVSTEFYERVCADQKTIIDTADIRNKLQSWDGYDTLQAWTAFLQSLPERCVEIDINAEHIFSIWIFGSPQVLSLWPSLSHSPILRQFTHSPLILGAFERNRHLFGVTDRRKSHPRPKLAGIFPDIFPRPRSKEEITEPTNSSSLEPLVPIYQLPHLYPHAPANPKLHDTIPGLLVLHIRRGDFADHCRGLAQWGSVFNGFNSFDDIFDRDGFESVPMPENPGNPPSEPELESDFATRIQEMSEQEKEQATKAYRESLYVYAAAKKDYEDRKAQRDSVESHYLERCFPDIKQIVKRVREIREAVAIDTAAKSKLDNQSPHSHSYSPAPTAPLTHLYIMTNGKPPFLAELRAALENDAILNNPLNLLPWDSIYTSRDLELGWEETYVAQSVDMYAAQRAEVFVGNGFSSLTSNIVMLRRANGVDSIKTRLW